MKKLLVLLSMITIVFSMNSCGYERIDAAHTGIRVNLYGDEKGVDAVAEVSGAIWYNPFRTEIYETPNFVQNVVWTADKREGSSDNEEFLLTTKDGMEIGVSVSLNYLVTRENSIPIFVKYRKSLDVVARTVLRNYTRDGFNDAASFYTAEGVYANRLEFQNKADSIAREILESEGFQVEKIVLVSSIRLPKAIAKSIESKVEAKQIALMKESELQQTTADAAKVVVAAQGKADAKRIKADAEAYAYAAKQRNLTTLLVQQQWIEKWNGNLGTGNVYGVGTIPYKNVSK